MVVLGIDTSTGVTTVGAVKGARLVGEYTLDVGRRQAELLHPVLKELLSRTGVELEQISGVGVVVGPGYFTALRIGVVAAKGLAQALKCPICGGTGLDILASRVTGTGYVLPVIDAARGEIFTALYRLQPDGASRISDYKRVNPDEVDSLLEDCGEGGVAFVGSAVEQYRDELIQALEASGRSFRLDPMPVRGAEVALMAHRRLEVGQHDNLFGVTPLYLRRSDAELSWEKKQGVE